VLVALLLLAAEPAASAVDTSFGVPLIFGGTLAPSRSGVAGRFSLAARPMISWQLTAASGLGLGLYGFAGTLRSFTDFAGGGGLDLTPPFPRAVRPVINVGAQATHDARGWQPCLEAGLYWGVHSREGAMAILGLRADFRFWLPREPRWAVTLGFTWDLSWPVQLGRILVSAVRPPGDALSELAFGRGPDRA
jgi:hypothetical protein